MYLLQLLHLIAMASTTFFSSLCLSSNKRNWNMANTFNNEGSSPLFGLRIFSVCSIMVRKGNQLIVSFIEVGQYNSISWRSIYFLAESLYTLASIFFSYTAVSVLIFYYWINEVWLISFNKGSTYVMKVLFVISSLSSYLVWI